MKKAISNLSSIEMEKFFDYVLSVARTIVHAFFDRVIIGKLFHNLDENLLQRKTILSIRTGANKRTEIDLTSSALSIISRLFLPRKKSIRSAGWIPVMRMTKIGETRRNMINSRADREFKLTVTISHAENLYSKRIVVRYRVSSSSSIFDSA